mgnify:CR=1 FL=1
MSGSVVRLTLALVAFGTAAGAQPAVDYLPREPGLEIQVRVGQKVQAGTTIMARYTGDV